MGHTIVYCIGEVQYSAMISTLYNVVILYYILIGEVQYPIMGPYQNSTIKRFNQLYPDGKSAVDVMDDTNNEPDCICRTVPVVTKWAGMCGRDYCGCGYYGNVG